MIRIREMKTEDEAEVLEMMSVFYDSPAVFYKAPEEVLLRDIRDCTGDCPYVEGYILEEGEAIAGYAMAAKGYSTEFGGLCLWLEDLYIKPAYRGSGIGSRFFEFLEEKYASQAVRIRLEVEKENIGAIKVYEKCGYKKDPYFTMSRVL